MNRSQHPEAAIPQWALRTAMALALVVAVGYLAIGLGFVSESFESPPAPVMVLAGLAYIVGGLLIVLADRRLLLLGTVINTLVLLLFVAAAVRGNSTLDLLSVAQKLAQVALGVLLFWFTLRAYKGSKGQRT